ncbi:group I intron-associated PD-(D/E)XK endonuclease [Ornithinimicrobium cavernae]|uniref:group I intron-associated PD-(D/E)XK endonuclease n=1 Tax=Ornithinimicrobium cavernae TaxID=2666047 RepID=UPI0012B16B7E|nr:group I intron-associated PD-(D/E)XK endonuclease [Ornithinimicrobium cavernae]
MPRARSYTDEDLVAAVLSSHSWRGVLRVLGLTATSSAAIRSVRRHADALQLDHSHFRGQRTWSEQQLRTAVAKARTWQEVAESLGLNGGSSQSTIRGHVVRLGIDAEHLAPIRPDSQQELPMGPSRAHLSRSGSLLAAGWFSLCGYQVSWPLEPCRYDLLVEHAGVTQRIQVKTTTVRTGRSWTVWLSTTGAERVPYAVDEIDAFFVIDGDLRYYLIPVERAGGLHAIQLSAYASYRLSGTPVQWP